MRPIGRGWRRHGGLPLRGVRELVPVPAVRAEAVAAQQVAPAPAHILRGASSRLPSFSHRSVRTAASSPFLRASSTPHIRVHALTASPPSSNQSRQVRRSGERGVDITVGAVGFLHVRDVVVRFHDGPVERVVVGDLLYTGQLLTLLAWLFEFVGKRARGVRLRDAIDDETSRATTAARDEAFDGTGAQSSQPSSSPLAPSAGAFIARSRSLARQSSSNPGFDPRSDPTTQSLGSPEPASSAGRRPSRASADGSSGNFMNLNVPVLAAGLRVKLRGVGPNGSSGTRERSRDASRRRRERVRRRKRRGEEDDARSAPRVEHLAAS